MGERLKLSIVVMLLWSAVNAQQYIQQGVDLWHYNGSAFKGWSDTRQRDVTIKNVTIQKKKWTKNEKRISLVVETDTKTYRDDFVFCLKEKEYFHCGIEDDGGEIRLDGDMNIQINVHFTKYMNDAPASELNIAQKHKDKWVHCIVD